MTVTGNPTWSALPRNARMYVAGIMITGGITFILSIPSTFPHPELFAVLLLLSVLTSAWKVKLPIPLASGSTLSVSYAANVMSLLLLGPRHAVLIAVVGVWTQCSFRLTQPYQRYRTAFSMAAEAITMAATGAVYERLGGSRGPFDAVSLSQPLVGAIATYFLLNTGLVASAIAQATGRSAAKVWREDFLWSGASFFVAGSAGALGAALIHRGEQWLALLMLAPVYLTYWTYQVFVGRLEDQARHLAHVTKGERALAMEKANAEQANQLKDQFLAIVSHELRTPLNAILGWSDMLRTGSLDEGRQARAVQAICDSARQQCRLIDELLDVSRIISGKLLLDRSAVDWTQIVRSALEGAQPAAAAKQIDIALRTGAPLAEFYGDAARLQQIVGNLLTNAVKFTPEGGAIRVDLRRINDTIELSVADTGVGIAREFMPHVFEPFRQADGSTTRSYGGLGLGLSIVRHLVEAHGGSIAAESGGEGRGSTFTVRLPIVPVPHQESQSVLPGSATPAIDVAASPASLEGISVLVVDDDDGSREVVATFLEGCSAAVYKAASASEAMDVLQRERVDVLLADIAMPGQDGYDLIRQVRAMESGTAAIPAAALTAFARAEDRNKALQAGFQLHLTKPIALPSLVDAVAALGRIHAAT